MRFALLFDKDLEFLQTCDIILRNSLIDNKIHILYLAEIFWKLDELNLSLQDLDMNIVHARQIIKAFINKRTTSVISQVWMARKMIASYKQLL